MNTVNTKALLDTQTLASTKALISTEVLAPIKSAQAAQTERAIGHAQSGFTLIELMISITLGLLILAATTQILQSSHTTTLSQQATSGLVDDSVFGISTLTNSVQMASFGARATVNQGSFILNDQTPQGGIVLTVPANKADATNNSTKGLLVPAANVSREGGTTTQSNINGQQSSQLTLQRLMREGEFDCEGNARIARPAGVDENKFRIYVIERYFLRVDNTTRVAGEPNPLALACDAAQYRFVAGGVQGNTLALATDRGFGDGVVLMPRVDFFRVLLGVDTANSPPTRPDRARIRYMTVADYTRSLVTNSSHNASDPTSNPKLPGNKIVAIRFGLIARAANQSPNAQLDGDQRFALLDLQPATPADAAPLALANAGNSRYQREVIESTILIRNARG